MVPLTVPWLEPNIDSFDVWLRLMILILKSLIHYIL